MGIRGSKSIGGFVASVRCGALVIFGALIGCSGTNSDSNQPQSAPNISDGLRLELTVEPGTELNPIRRRKLKMIYTNVSNRVINLDGRQVWGRLQIVDSNGRLVPVAEPPPFRLWDEKYRIRLEPGQMHTVRVELASETIDKLDGPWYFVTTTFEVDAARLPPNTGLWTGRVQSNRVRLASR